MARNEAIESPRAYRLVFRFSLRSTSAGFMGMMATPSITAKLVPVDKTGSLPATEKARASLPVPSDLVSGGASRRTWRAEGPAAASQTGQDVVPDDHFAEAIFVLRNLRSDAVAPK
jgi:hypothetical protein